MGSLFCQNYKYASEGEIDIEEFIENDKDYTPRIEGTELIIGVKLFSAKYFFVLTKRLIDGWYDYLLLQNITGDYNE